MKGVSGHRNLVLPNEVWNPVLKEFGDWLSPATEAPMEYAFATAYVAIGLAIGRDVYVQMGRRLYCNSCVGLIGPAGIKKGTPWALIQGEIIGPHINEEEWGLRIVRSTGSAEGLLQCFMVEKSEKDEKGRRRMALRPVPELRVVTIEEELGYFLVKAHSDATANLREITCQLWDGVDVSPPTRSRSLVVKEPFYSMLAMTTPETLEARLEEDDILTGLLPRFIFFEGSVRPPLAWPDAPGDAGARALLCRLADIRGHAKELRQRGNRNLRPNSAVQRAWEEAYPSLRRRALEAAIPAVGRMLARIEVHIVKAALLYAVCAGHSQIEEDDLGHALALGDYLSVTAAQVAGTQMGSDVRRVEYKIMTLLEQNPGVWVRVRDLQQRLSGRVDADRFHKALRALIKLDRLESDPCGSDERPKYVRANVEGWERSGVDADVDGSRT